MSATDCTTCPAPARSRSGLAGLAALTLRALATRRERNRLAQLDARLLDDIGLTPRMAEDEAARPVWDVPQYWRR